MFTFMSFHKITNFLYYRQMLLSFPGQIIKLLIIYSVITYFVEMECDHHTGFFLWSERVIAAIFTVEYLVRWYLSKNKKLYPFTIMAIIDLVAILPFWIGFFVSVETLKWVRTLRLLRLLKLNRYNSALKHLLYAFHEIRHEMAIVGFVSLLIIVLGAVVIYEVENPAQPDKFVKISDALWYSVVTLTTVGYGDLCPVTTAGRIIAVIMMIMGTGIFGTFISLLGARLLEKFREDANGSKF